MVPINVLRAAIAQVFIRGIGYSDTKFGETTGLECIRTKVQLLRLDHDKTISAMGGIDNQFSDARIREENRHAWLQRRAAFDVAHDV